MPNTTRRLPGGRQRPVGRRVTPRPAVTSDPSTVAAPDSLGAEAVAVKPAPRPAGLPEATRKELSQRVGVSVAERRGIVSRTSVTSRSAPRGQSSRTGPSPLELASTTYGHIRTDLLRIGVLATVMLAIIVTLSFVII